MVEVQTPGRAATSRTERSRSAGTDFTIGDCNPGVTRRRENLPKSSEALESRPCPPRVIVKGGEDRPRPANPMSLTVTPEATGSSRAPWAASRSGALGHSQGTHRLDLVPPATPSAIALFLMAAPASRNRSGVTPGRDSCPLAAWPFRGQSAFETALSSRSPESSRRAVPESSSALDPSSRSPLLKVKRSG